MCYSTDSTSGSSVSNFTKSSNSLNGDTRSKCTDEIDFHSPQWDKENDRNMPDTWPEEQVRALVAGEKLSTRGTGPHYCPYKKACRKGGWKDGRAVEFYRNSAFRYVHRLHPLLQWIPLSLLLFLDHTCKNITKDINVDWQDVGTKPALLDRIS